MRLQQVLPQNGSGSDVIERIISTSQISKTEAKSSCFVKATVAEMVTAEIIKDVFRKLR